MPFSRITGLAINSAPGSIFSARLKKKDAGDSPTNAHGTGNARLTPGAGTGSGTPIAVTWIYDPSTVGGGYTHYADISLPDGYFNGRPWTVDARDTSSDSYETFTGIEFEPGGPDVTLFTSSGSVPSAPTLTKGAVTASSIGLSWASVSDADSYKLFYSADNSTFLPYGGTITSTNITVSGLTAATRYYFYLKATNGIGDSTASATVNEITTSTGGGTETPVPTVVRHNSALQLYRHAYKFVVNTLPFAVVNMEVGAVIRAASANSAGVCTLTPTEKIPVDVSTVRFRATANNSTSAWTSAITVIDAPNSVKWAAILPADDDYEAWEGTFSGDPDSLPDFSKGQYLSPSPRAAIETARADAFTYLATV